MIVYIAHWPMVNSINQMNHNRKKIYKSLLFPNFPKVLKRGAGDVDH